MKFLKCKKKKKNIITPISFDVYSFPPARWSLHFKIMNTDTTKSIINLTHKPVIIYANDKKTVLKVYPTATSSESAHMIPGLKEYNIPTKSIDGIPVYIKKYVGITGYIPKEDPRNDDVEHEPNIYYIVSALVALGLSQKRYDIIIQDFCDEAIVRDPITNEIIGSTRFCTQLDFNF